jgi:hypothetical protein
MSNCSCMDATTHYTMDEVCEILNVTPRTVYYHIKLGRLERILIKKKRGHGGCREIRISKESVHNFVAGKNETNFERLALNPTAFCPIADPKGLVIDNWNRYYRMFNKHLFDFGLTQDLNQALELIAIQVARCPSVEIAGQLIGREIRSFLASVGFNKINGRYVRRERLFSETFWDMTMNNKKAILWNGVFCINS